MGVNVIVPVSHPITGRLWIIVNNCLTLILKCVALLIRLHRIGFSCKSIGIILAAK